MSNDTELSFVFRFFSDEMSIHVLGLTAHWTGTKPVSYPGILLRGGGGLKSSVEARGQRERGSGGGSPLVRGSTQFANE
jgi:hypothetical protein